MRYIFIFLLVVIPSVHAYGLASDFLEERTMYMYPGEVREYNIEIQNTDPAVLDFKLELTSDIAQIKDPEATYAVGGENNIRPVTIIVTAPEEAQIGQEYRVEYSILPEMGANQQIDLNLKLGNSFRVIIGEKPPEQEYPSEVKHNNYVWAIAVIALIIIIAVIFRKNLQLMKR